jgi:hypothetical protein
MLTVVMAIGLIVANMNNVAPFPDMEPVRQVSLRRHLSHADGDDEGDGGIERSEAMSNGIYP